MNAAFWNAEVKDQFNGSLFQAGTAQTIGVWTASAGTPNAGSTGTFQARYVKLGRRVFVDFYVLPNGTGASYGNAGSSWTFTLPFTAVTGNPMFNGLGGACPNGTDVYAIRCAMASTTTVVIQGPTTNLNSRLTQIGNAGVAGTAWIVGSGWFAWSFAYESTT